MRSDKQRALALRLRGHSYTEIQKKLGVPKGTLSAWFSELVLSDKARERISHRVRDGVLRGLVARNVRQTSLAQARARMIHKEAKKELGDINKKELLLIGTALYWAEGYKRLHVINGKERTSHDVRLSNSDPFLVKMFLRFLREVCNVPEEKIIASLHLYEHINEQEARRYWRGVTGLSEKSFRKTYYGISKSSLHRRPFNRLPYGTIQISVNNTALFHRILGWIDGLTNQSRTRKML